MTTTTATATHRVFDVINGLYPVTFANVREADPEGLLDIFEGAENTRDAYFDMLRQHYLYLDNEDIAQYRAGIHTFNNLADIAAEEWADWLAGSWGHDEDCDCDRGCTCQQRQWNNNQVWGKELYQIILQRIRELND
jgi:hypothetical protein